MRRERLQHGARVLRGDGGQNQLGVGEICELARRADDGVERHPRQKEPVLAARVDVGDRCGLARPERWLEPGARRHLSQRRAPGAAAEVARGLPTAITLACPDAALAAEIAAAIATATFRPYLSGDMIGAEAGGAIKNVLAIACGVVEGRGLGRSAHAALVTRGFAELTRLAAALGGRAETVAGLCGLGDLVLTCSSLQSRNTSLGFALGRGESVEEALAGKSSVAEGVASAPAVRDLAFKLGVETPISNEVAAILAGERSIDEAIAALLARPLRAET